MTAPNPRFDLKDLAHWIGMAQVRWDWGSHRVTAELQGPWLTIYQNGEYRARIDLTDARPYLQDFADEEA